MCKPNPSAPLRGIPTPTPCSPVRGVGGEEFCGGHCLWSCHSHSSAISQACWPPPGWGQQELAPADPSLRPALLEAAPSFLLSGPSMTEAWLARLMSPGLAQVCPGGRRLGHVGVRAEERVAERTVGNPKTRNQDLLNCHPLLEHLLRCQCA